MKPLKRSLPEPPSFTQHQLDQARETGDLRPLLFEWYKYVGLLCIYLAMIAPKQSPALRQIVPRHFAIVVGLLNRCSRLMLSNMQLASSGRHGETTVILDRCIFESATKAMWLCETRSDENFQRYVADGLKPELGLKREIKKNISERDPPEALVIERRMLESIDRYISLGGLDDASIATIKKMPSLEHMLTKLERDPIAYLVGQRLGSHSVHGTWSSLLTHYLEENDEGGLSLRDNNVEMHTNQFIGTPLFVLDMLASYLRFIVEDPQSDELQELMDVLRVASDEILKLDVEAAGDDFTIPEV